MIHYHNCFSHNIKFYYTCHPRDSFEETITVLPTQINSFPCIKLENHSVASREKNFIRRIMEYNISKHKLHTHGYAQTPTQIDIKKSNTTTVLMSNRDRSKTNSILLFAILHGCQKQVSCRFIRFMCKKCLEKKKLIPQLLYTHIRFYIKINDIY